MTTTSLNLDKAIGAALATLDRNLVTFADIYPHDATEDGVYPEPQARRGYPPGSHTGWTTGFWAGMLWLAYELTRSVTVTLSLVPFRQQAGQRRVRSRLERRKSRDLGIF